MNISRIFDGSKTSVWKLCIKTAIYIPVYAFIISCSSNQTAELPEYWEYSPGKWITFQETIELEWIHDKVDVDRFEIKRAAVKLENSEVQDILMYFRDKRLEMLIKKEHQLKERQKNDNTVIRVSSVESLSYEDTKKPVPTFGEACFYQVRAMKNSDASEPSEISVIFINKACR